MKKHFSTIILILVFFVGLSVLLYPTISNYINQKNQSRAVIDYDTAVSKMKKDDYNAYFKKAELYNQMLAKHPSYFYEPDQLPGYNNILNIEKTGMMGYISIEKIGVELPIYHGTSDSILQSAAGHLKGTSFPIGGTSTHSVISAHRGLPSAKLFTNLDELEKGDTFTITILDRLLTYEVDSISIVLPDKVDQLQIQEGKDYCTLMTCTPYGINTHRLLVRGHRIPNKKDSNIRVISDAYQIEPIVIAPIIAGILLFLLLVWMLIRNRRKKTRGEKNEK
ncbi:class C sortase [Anaerostipes sp. MSJ-23]|uniref:class C sortase n=1 Tax=Anaerostipes sp. MSJ-23 TaxID=2841520 RepID=UPI001C11EE54|nr:class C sortase [Anaerostipes sp. MSJ-23]MBU5459318.1 class C sortase [Anaerostipes sp. MSJ-23]